MGLHFSKEEFSSRKSKVIKSMKEQNIDALLMFRQESMYWLTGYDTFGYVFFQTLVLDQRGNTILLTRAPDLRQAKNTSNIEDIRIWIDKDGSNPTDDLKEMGLTISEGHAQRNVNGADVVVYSSAVQRDNPEILAAKRKQVPVIRRAEMLAELLKVKTTSIAIAGTHGKTSTCSMLGAILTEAELSPTMVIGGIVNKFQSTELLLGGDYLVSDPRIPQPLAFKYLFATV